MRNIKFEFNRKRFVASVLQSIAFVLLYMVGGWKLMLAFILILTGVELQYKAAGYLHYHNNIEV